MVVLLIIFAFIVFLYFISTSSSGTDANQAALQSCLTTAQDTYSQNWEKECIAEGGDGGLGLNCKINVIQANLLDNRFESAKNDCYHAYPQ